MSVDLAVRVCDLCNADAAKYQCPRCGVPYCSLKCYKDPEKHLQCSESFYRDCVVEDLKAQQNEPQDAKRMAEALQRFHNQYGDGEGPDGDSFGDEEDLDSDDDEPLVKRLEGVSLDDADEVWKNLTEEERSEFQKLVKSVNAQEFVPQWTPWWTRDPELPKLVQEVVGDEDEKRAQDEVHTKSRKIHPEQPDIMKDIPSMKSLTRVLPNDHVKRRLANVISSYVWTSQLYNGEFLTYDNPYEVAAALITLSSFLSKDAVFGTYEHAIMDISLNACRTPELFDGGPTLQSSLSKDVFTILNGHSSPASSVITLDKKLYTLSALSECFQLLSTVSKIKKPSAEQSQSQPLDGESSSFGKTFRSTNSILIDPKLMTKAKRKLHYLLAFANEHDIL